MSYRIIRAAAAKGSLTSEARRPLDRRARRQGDRQWPQSTHQTNVALDRASCSLGASDLGPERPVAHHRLIAFFDCISTRYHALLYLTYLAGLRIGETLALRERDVDLDLLKVHVTRGKTGERIVPLPVDPKLVQSLARWLQVRKSWPASDLLFITRSGEPIRPSAVRRSMALAAESAT